jgi:hypothetical protein
MVKDDCLTDETGSVKTKKVALRLGYISLALGALEVAAPRRPARSGS